MIFAIDLSQCVILDCETTGIGDDDEIIELAIIRADNGEILFDEQFNPKKIISDEAFALHGIRDGSLVGKPRFKAHFNDMMKIVDGKTIIGWRIAFDRRLLWQTMTSQGVSHPSQSAKFHDLKPDYINYLQAIDEQSVHLVTACQHEGVNISDLAPHRALSDCLMLYRLLHQMRKK